MGSSLYATAVKIEKEVEGNREPTEEELKFLKCKKFEEDGDLAFFSYSSWNVLPPPCKDVVTELLDPLVWNGVYFQYSKFIDHESSIFQRLDTNMCAYAVKVVGAYEFAVHSPSMGTTPSDYLSDRDLIKFKKEFMNKCLRSYSVVEGEVIINVR